MAGVTIVIEILRAHAMITDMIQEVRGNEKRCKRLVERLTAFMVPLERIRKTPSLHVDSEALLRLQDVFKDAHTLIQTFTTMSWMSRAASCKSVSADFDEITLRLNTARDDLHFEMHIQQHIMDKEDKRDAEDDFEALQNHLERMMKDMMDQKERKDEARFEQLLGLLKSARLSVDQEIIGFQEIDFNELKPVVHGQLGEGSFGQVSRVLFHGREVAMKSMVAEALLTQSDVQDLREEVKIHAKLHFPGIVQLLGACTVKPRLCLVMELAPHGSLFNLLHVDKINISWTDRCACIWDIASAVAYLHSRKILHRDIKTPNILVFENLRLKLCDFGLSKVKSTTRASAYTKASGAGTCAYMPPEIHEGLKHTEAADIYSTAIVMSELITGQVPFPNKMQIQIARAVCDRKERPAIPTRSENDPPLREELIEVMEKCWDADPSQRMSGEDLRDTLCDIVERSGGDSRSRSSLGTPTRKENGCAGRVQHANCQSAKCVSANAPAMASAYYTITEPASAPATVREHWNDSKEPSLSAIDPPPSVELPTPPPSYVSVKVPELPKLLVSGSMIDDLAELRTLRRKPAELKQQVDFVIEVMRTYFSSADVQEAACASISTLCSQDTLTAASVGSKGGCDLVVAALQSYSGQATILCKVLDAISRLSTEKSNRALFAGMDIAEKIVACMTVRRHMENYAVQQGACLALANLSLNADIRQRLISDGGCGIVIDAMKKFANVPAIQEYSLLVIHHVATIQNTSMPKTASGSRLAKFTNRAQAPLSEVNTDLVSIREAGACESVVSAMMMHRSLVRVQTNACLALAALCDNVENQTQLGTLGACELVATALNNKSIPQVQESALKAVIKLCEHNETNKVRFSNACGNVLEDIVESTTLSPVVIQSAQHAQEVLSGRSTSDKLKGSFSSLRAGLRGSTENILASMKGSGGSLSTSS